MYLQNEVPAPNPTRENLRNQDDIPKIRGFVLYENTFIPRTICDWNALSNEVKDISNNETFGQKLTRDTKIPRWYYQGERLANTWHARMRMKCSKLNDDLYSHIHVIESPLCSCGYRRETSKHYLLDCPLYAEDRRQMLSDLDQIGFKPTAKNLLFGNTSYTDELNCQATDIIQRYIKATERFV